MSKKASPPNEPKREAKKEQKETTKLVGPIATVPLLHYAAGRVDLNNFAEWLPKMELSLASIHGEASYSLISGELWLIPLPAILEGGPALVTRRKEESYVTLNKDRDKQIIKLQREIYPAFFVKVWDQMSLCSQDRVKMAAGDAYADMMRKKDFMALVKHVKASHLGTTREVTEEDKRRVTESFSRLKQGAGESLAEFKARFDSALTTYDAVKEPRPTQTRLAVEYISKLDPVRFSTMRAEIENQRALHPSADPTPKTLAAAHELAATWKTTASKPGPANDVPMFATGKDDDKASKSSSKTAAGGKEKADKGKEKEKDSSKGRGA